MPTFPSDTRWGNGKLLNKNFRTVKKEFSREICSCWGKKGGSHGDLSNGVEGE